MLGESGSSVLLAGLPKVASQIAAFTASFNDDAPAAYGKCERFLVLARRAGANKFDTRGPVSAVDPLPAVIATVLKFPNLKIVQLAFPIKAKKYPSLKRLLQSQTIERLALDEHGFTANLLHRFLVDVAAVLPDSPLRHLSLTGGDIAAADHSIDLAEDLMGLLRTSGKGGLEYVLIYHVEIIVRDEQVRQLVEHVKHVNKTILDIELWEPIWPSWDALQIALERNKRARIMTQRTALELLPVIRTLFLRPSSDFHMWFSALSIQDGVGIVALPSEIIMGIVCHMRTGTLSRRQLLKIADYAADRATLRRYNGATSQKEFLDRVDCWKWDGVVTPI